MTRPIRLAIFALLFVMAVTAAAIPWLLPPPVAATGAPDWQPEALAARGAYHVHSLRSDGTGTIDDIAAAASRAGLQFVIVTDHGNGTRPPDPPRYRSGVLCIDGVEVSTTDGHLVVVGAQPSPYPLGGRAAAVLEDVHRLGGMGIAAHPGSPRPSLRWRDWSIAADGIEWLNADSEWRDEFLGSIGRYLLTYRLRPAETLAATLDRPATVLEKWDELTATRRVVALAGADAHARLGFRRQTDPYEEGWHLKVPSYEASFSAFGIRVQLPMGLSGDAARDAENVITHIRLGRVYTVIDGLATPGAFEFTATSGDRRTDVGGYLDVRGPVTLHARAMSPAGSRMVILRDGRVFFDSTDAEVHLGVEAQPAVYRVEIRAPGAAGEPPIPWVVANPIYVGMRDLHQAALRPVPAAPVGRRDSVATEAWGAEASAGSESVLEPRVMADGVAAIEWRFQLADGPPAGQYAAVRFPVDGLATYDRLQLRGRASQAMRVWVQLRASAVKTGERWGRSVYLDSEFQSLDVSFDELEPLGPTTNERPPLDRVDAVLLVVDTVNTVPGTKGSVQIADLWLTTR